MLYSSRQSSSYSGPWWSLLSETTRVFFLLLWATTDLSFIKTGFISVTFPLPLCRLWSNWLPRGQNHIRVIHSHCLHTLVEHTYLFWSFGVSSAPSCLYPSMYEHFLSLSICRFLLLASFSHSVKIASFTLLTSLYLSCYLSAHTLQVNHSLLLLSIFLFRPTNV